MSDTFETASTSDTKIVFPGELGFSDHEPISTFAFGAKDGCRALLFYDRKIIIAACAHVDFLDQDISCARIVANEFKRKKAENVSLVYSDNIKPEALLSIQDLFSDSSLETDIFTSTRFTFNPRTRLLTYDVDMNRVKSVYPVRIPYLQTRLQIKKHDLYRV